MKPKVLVTGATGFVGSHLVERLIQRDYEVIVSLRRQSSSKWLDPLDIETRLVDWKDSYSVNELVQGVDILVHCAGVTKALNYNEYHRGNVLPTSSLLREAKENGSLSRFIFVSSQAVAGPSNDLIPLTEDSPCHPLTDYGITKLKAEKQVLQYQDDFPVTLLRPCSIYGPRDHEFYPVFKLLKYHLSLLIGSGTMKVNMIHVHDFVESIVRVIEKKPPSGRTYFVTDGHVYGWPDITQTAGEVYKKKALTIKLPIVIPKTLGWINDKVSKLTKKPTLLNSQKVKEMLQDAWLCDSRLMREELDWIPSYTLLEGFRETLSWYQENKWL
ncbi:MAG: NAD-dependent epimerase [bacterium]|nr:MAG: NAD-dependent epimerase [bacterium]